MESLPRQALAPVAAEGGVNVGYTSMQVRRNIPMATPCASGELSGPAANALAGALVNRGARAHAPLLGECASACCSMVHARGELTGR